MREKYELTVYFWKVLWGKQINCQRRYVGAVGKKKAILRILWLALRLALPHANLTFGGWSWQFFRQLPIKLCFRTTKIVWLIALISWLQNIVLTYIFHFLSSILPCEPPHFKLAKEIFRRKKKWHNLASHSSVEIAKPLP